MFQLLESEKAANLSGNPYFCRKIKSFSRVPAHEDLPGDKKAGRILARAYVGSSKNPLNRRQRIVQQDTKTQCFLLVYSIFNGKRLVWEIWRIHDFFCWNNRWKWARKPFSAGNGAGIRRQFIPMSWKSQVQNEESFKFLACFFRGGTREMGRYRTSWCKTGHLSVTAISHAIWLFGRLKKIVQ